jgi:NTE family protein
LPKPHPHASLYRYPNPYSVSIIERTRLAGDPPHVLLLPRLREIGLMEFQRGREAIEEGRACVEQALPALWRYL